MEDRRIIALYFSRDQEAIRVTDAVYGRYCRTIARNILFDARDSEECVNDTYLDAWNAIPPARPLSLKAFLGRLTRNNAINRYEYNTAAKRGGGERTLCIDELSEGICSNDPLSGKAEEEHLVTAINGFLSVISKEQRIIFVKRYFYECSIKEICTQLGTGESRVKITLMRLREKLKKHLEKEGVHI